MTMSFVMPAAWFLNTSLHQAVSMAGFCPQSTAQWALRMSPAAELNTPSVNAFGRMCGMRHTCVGTRLQPSRPSDELMRQCQWFATRPVPWPVMMASGPYSSLMRRHSSAMMSMASSQLMRSNSLLPRFSGLRSPFGSQSTRFMG